MHHMTLKAAVKKYGDLYEQGATWEELSAEMIKAGHTEDEAKEVMEAILKVDDDQGEGRGDTGSGTGSKPPADSETKLAQTVNPSATPVPGSPYSQYDLWRVEIHRMERRTPGTNDMQVIVSGFEAIKKIRGEVKIEPSVAEDINAQSHNSAMRYYPVGTVTPGDVEKIDLSTY